MSCLSDSKLTHPIKSGLPGFETTAKELAPISVFIYNIVYSYVFLMLSADEEVPVEAFRQPSPKKSRKRVRNPNMWEKKSKSAETKSGIHGLQA